MEGSLNIYVPGNSLPVEHISLPVEHNENADAIAAIVNSIRNKVSAIDELMESVAADLGLIELEHIDDNGKELAQCLKKRFQQIESEFYWKVIEREDSNWMASSLNFMVGLLADQNTQKLVMPQLRAQYDEITKDEDLTKEEKEKEFSEWLTFIRKDFNLSEKFR